MSARGQTLALAALTILIIALGVVVTLSISVRIHEKQELQLAADGAAYSQAVATARAFNAVSAENRMLIAQLSSIAAAQSMLSWVGYYHGVLNQARDALWDLKPQASCGGKVIDDAVDKIMAEDQRLIWLFEKPGCGYDGQRGYDPLSAEYIRTDLYRTALEIADDQRKVYDDMVDKLPAIAKRVALDASQSDPFKATGEEFRVSALHEVTREERKRAVEDEQRQPIDMVRATMAARGQDPFVSSRSGNTRTQGVSGGEFIAKRLQKVIEPTPFTVRVTDFGTSYFGDEGPHRDDSETSLWGETRGYNGDALSGPLWLKWKRVAQRENLEVSGAWGQDSGRFYIDWPNPPAGCNIGVATEDAFGYLLTTGPNDHRDAHMWRRGQQGFGDYREWHDELHHVYTPCESEPRHTFKLQPDPTRPMAIWPVFTDFQADRLDQDRDSQLDAFGQPKTMVAIRRDYGARRALKLKDPWELHFRFGFTSAADELDLRASRTDFDHAIGLASGFVYYHRANHFREPPNFLSPFWRATLAASDVDEPFGKRGRSARRTLDDFDEHRAAETLNRLVAHDYEAVP